MKISIITCHCPYNYGAVLQAYALQQHIETLNEEVIIIDYRPDYLTSCQSLTYVGNDRFKKNIFIKLMFILLRLPVKLRHRKNFNNFIERKLHLSAERYYNYEQLTKNIPIADKYICGSDQIWNVALPNGTDESYYLSFIEDNSKKISYAASISVTEISDDKRTFISERVAKISNISVREDNAKTFLESVIDNEISHVLDPVFLLSKESWAIIENESNYLLRKENYLLVYIMGNDNTNVMKSAYEIASKKGLVIYVISMSLRRIPNIAKKFKGVSPATFLRLFKNADFIVTNSFHGVAFSLIYNKQFIACNIGNTNSRILSLLRSAELMPRFINNSETISVCEEIIDYDIVNRILNEKIEFSKKFIQKAISNN